MAGTLTLGGMADNTAAGNLDFGPATVSGKRVIGRVEEIELAANVELAVKVPSEATQWAAFFGTASSAPEVKVGSNVVAATSGYPQPAQGFMSGGCTLITELKFKAATPPASFTLVFI